MANKKERLLFLRELLLAETDENHYITMEEIARRLQADRRTIEQDIDTLIQSGIDIEKKPRPKLSYAVLSRDFTLEEIKNFFQNYKTLQNIEVKVYDYHDEQSALKLIAECQKRYLENVK